jgi:ATP synthase protein I
MTDDNTDGLTTGESIPRTHGESVRKLADAMLRAALWPGVATVVVGITLSTVFAGVDGMVGALIGGVLAFASSLATVWLMRKTSALGPQVVMAAGIGGMLGKMILLLIVLIVLDEASWLHRESLAFTMLATVLVWAAMEAIAFRRTKIPTLIVDPDDR